MTSTMALHVLYTCWYIYYWTVFSKTVMNEVRVHHKGERLVFDWTLMLPWCLHGKHVSKGCSTQIWSFSGCIFCLIDILVIFLLHLYSFGIFLLFPIFCNNFYLSWYTTFILKWVLLALTDVYRGANQTHFHTKRWAPGTVLKQRQKATRKWPICCSSRSLYLKQSLIGRSPSLHFRDFIYKSNYTYDLFPLFLLLSHCLSPPGV